MKAGTGWGVAVVAGVAIVLAVATVGYRVMVDRKPAAVSTSSRATVPDAKSLVSPPALSPAKPAVVPDLIWQDRGDIGSLDLNHGAGGKAHAPDPAGTFTFVEVDQEASSPKFEVVDASGVSWKVKLGEESQPETAATRFLWAAGYFVDEDYYLPTLTVKGLPKLERGHEFVSDGGVVRGARLERKLTGVKKDGNWDWYANPFTGQRELNGLRVMMSLLNNWDLKAVNNTIYVVDGERHYAISDAGATFGNTGNTMTRSKGVPKEYEASKFIAKITPAYTDFVLHTTPFAMWGSSERAKMETITKHIPRADARWLGQRLSRLTATQIRDAFRAAGYGVGDIEDLTRIMRKRIAALEKL